MLRGSLKRLEIYHWEAPLLRPLETAGGILSSRSVLLFHWHTNSETWWTEAAPLPGFSVDSLEICTQQLLSLKKFPVDALIDSDTCAQQFSPAVEFAIASLQLLNGNKRYFPRLCPVVHKGENVVNLSGVAPAKIKVAAGDFYDDLDFLNSLVSQQKFSGLLRLDANRGWNIQQIVELQAALDCTRLEWLEDPCSQFEHYYKWNEFSKIPLALDETLYLLPEAELFLLLDRLRESLAAVILKPMLLGWSRYKKIAEWAQQHRVRVVISSTYETGIGMAALNALAQRWPQEYHGLDTLRLYPEPFRGEKPDFELNSGKKILEWML